jgi:hypothetical protein
MLLSVEISIMTALSVNHYVGWTRTEIDEVTGASVGMCERQPTPFEISDWFLYFIPVVLSAIMAWKTLDIDYAYSEAKWVLALILLHLNVSTVCPVCPANHCCACSDYGSVSYIPAGVDSRPPGYASYRWGVPQHTIHGACTALFYIPHVIHGIDHLSKVPASSTDDSHCL